MHLSPRERADFDSIVARLRMDEVVEDPGAPRRHSLTLLLNLSVALLGFTIGLAVFVHRPEILVPLAVLAVTVGGLAIARRIGRTRTA